MDINENYYLAATQEFDSELRDDGKWAKSMALYEGDERKAKYTYINLRAKELEQKANKGRGATDSVASMKTDDKGANQRPITSQLVSGDLGLAKTF